MACRGVGARPRRFDRFLRLARLASAAGRASCNAPPRSNARSLRSRRETTRTSPPRTTPRSSKHSRAEGVEHEIVIYDGAPHSFFDRKQEEFAEASDDAWRRTLAFIVAALVILAIDQGTTGTTCLVVDEELHVHRRGYAELPQHFPRPGWVEHDPEEIWQSVLAAAACSRRRRRRHDRDHEPARDDAALGPRHRDVRSRPRSSGRTGEPPTRCRELDAELIRERTGLVPDPYFSATKLEWLLREHGRAGLAFGTVDSWLVWKLTERTDARDRRDERLADACWRPCGRSTGTTSCSRSSASTATLLPRIVRSAEAVGEGELLGTHACRFAGSPATNRRRSSDRAATRRVKGKATYGTGSFVLVHTGDDASAAAARTAEDGSRGRLRARRCGAGRRCGAPVAARRPRLICRCGRERGACTERRIHRWRRLRARAHRPRLAVVGCRCARPDRGAHPRHDNAPIWCGRRSRRSRTRSPTSSMRCPIPLPSSVPTAARPGTRS